MEYTNSQIRELISEYIHSERDRAVLNRRLVDGLTFERLAEEFDMSVRQVKNIVYRLQDELFKHMPV
jgi:DNA-directed RNA polymerase specialized sigma24 family protein